MLSSLPWICLRVLCLTIGLASRFNQVGCGAGLTVTPSPGLISSSTGSVVTLSCMASHSPSICLWRTPYQAIYTVGGGRVWEEGRLTSSLLASSNTCGLTIDKVEARDGGVWQCEVGSVVNGDFTTTTASTTVTVTESVEKDTSLVLLRLLGEETVLPCSIDSIQSPGRRSIDFSSEKMCRWSTPYNRTYSLKDDEYEERGRLQRSRSENCNLRVASLQSRDQGRWVCQVGHSGTHNLQEKQIILKLESPLKLSAPTSILQHADERATLVCHANKEYDNCQWTTPYQVTYQFDNNQHRSHEQGRLEYFGFSSMDCGIVIRGLGTRDSGGWTCRVQATVQGRTSNSTDIVRLFVEPKRFEEVPLSEEFGSDYILDYKTTEYDAFDYINGDFDKVANKTSVGTIVSTILAEQNEQIDDIVKDINRVANSGTIAIDNPRSQHNHDQHLPVFPAGHQDSDITTGVNSRELEFLERISGSRIDNRPIRIDGEENFGSRQSNNPRNNPEKMFQFGQVKIEMQQNNSQVLQGNSNIRNKHRKQDQVRRIHELIEKDTNLRISQQEIKSKETLTKHNETPSNGQFENNDELNTKTEEERRLLQTKREQHHFQELQRRREEAKQRDELRRLREFQEKRNKEKGRRKQSNIETKEPNMEEQQKEIKHKNNILLEEQRRKALEDQRQIDLEEKRQQEIQEKRQKERKALEDQRQRDLEEKRQLELQERRQQERKELEDQRKRDLEEKRHLEFQERRQQDIKNRRQKEIEEKRQKDILQLRQKLIEEKRKKDIEERRVKEIEERRLKEIEERRLKEIEERRLIEIEERRLEEIEEKRLKEIEEKRLKEIEDKRLKEIEERRLIEIEERRLKERRLKEIEQRRLKEIQERRLKEIEEKRLKRIKERKQIQEERLKELEEKKELEERRRKLNTKRRKQQNEEKRLKEIEERRLQEIEERRLKEIEEKRLKEIEEKRLKEIEEEKLKEIEQRKQLELEERRQLEEVRKIEEEKIAEEKRQKEISEKIKEEKRRRLIEQRIEQHMQQEMQRKEQERLLFLLRLEEEKKKEKKRKAEEVRKLELAKRLGQEKKKFEDRRRQRIRQEEFEKQIEAEKKKVRSRLKEEDKKEIENRREEQKTEGKDEQAEDQEKNDGLKRIKEDNFFKEEQIRLNNQKHEDELHQIKIIEENLKNQKLQAERERKLQSEREQLKLERKKLEEQQKELRRQQELLELSKKQQQEQESSQPQNTPIEKECVISPWPEAGNITCPEALLSRGRYSVPHGSLCSLECQPGFVSVERREATCSSGSWDAVLQCVRPGAMLVVGGRSDTYGVLSSVELLTSGGVCRGAVPPIPAMRWKMVAATLDGDTVLVCGGINFLGDPKTTCWALQLQPPPGSTESFTPSWLEMEGLSVPRDAAGWAAEGGSLFVMGGSLGPLSGYTASVEVWDGARWSVGPSLSSSRASHCAVGLGNGSIIVTGGYGALRAVQRLDISTRTWTNLPSLNPLRAQHGCALVELDGRRGVMVAGGDSGGTRLNDVRFLSLDPAATWTRLADLNTARWGRPSIGVIGGRITVVGGWDGVKALSSVEYYDERSETWQTSRISRLSTERRWAAATQINTKLFPKCVSKRQ